MTEEKQPPNGATIFVGGPIQYASRDEGFDLSLQKLIVSVIGILENAAFRVLSAHLSEQFGAAEGPFLPQEVTRRDYNWMQECDLYIAILPVRNSVPYRTDGTHIELGWAAALKRPVAIIGASPLGEEYSHLVRGLGELTAVATLNEAEVEQSPPSLVRCVLELVGDDSIANLAGAGGTIVDTAR